MHTITSRFSSNFYNDGIFNVGPEHGFLPIKDPLVKLPSTYSELQDILDKMPVWLQDGTNGYLHYENALKSIVTGSLPNYLDLVDKEEDPFIIQALYRGYTFLASAYILEPAYSHYKKTGNYGKAHNFLPANVSQPLFCVAKKLNVAPYQDYHYSYSLGNYVRKDTSKGLTWDNLDMAVRYSGTPDEVGFIMVHVDINANSPNLITSINNVLTGISEGDKDKIIGGLKMNYETMCIINERRKQMWKASDWKNYNSFRIFIMGSRGNTEIFGEGVVYEGTSDDGLPQTFRGQTGAQDDIIPTEDIFTGLIKYYPENKLTEYLMDLRNYRPVIIQQFFKDLEGDDRVKDMMSLIKSVCGNDGLVYLLLIVNEIYNFRNGHWQFVQKYIMSNTKYSVATGGTPITTWIPNQLEATLLYSQDIMMSILDNKDDKFSNDNIKSLFDTVLSQHKQKRDTLELQIKELNSHNIGLLTEIDFSKLNGLLAEYK